MDTIRNFLISAGLPGEDAPVSPDSPLRFPDGGQYRIEIPSTEGPRSLTAVLDEAEARHVPVHRISQGSGIMLLTDDEIREMAAIGTKHSIEVNLFLGPRASFDIGAQAFSAAGKSIALSQRGSNQLAQGLAGIEGLRCDASLVDSNLVFFEIDSNLGTAVQFCGAIKEQGILIGPMGGQRMRAVTHLDVSAEDISRALEVVRSCLSKGLANQTAAVGSGPYSK